MYTCTYTAKAVSERSGKGDYECDNPAHKDGRCKFHLEGYLDKSTAGKVRELFWKLYDEPASGLMDCTGYVLPSLVLEKERATLKRALCLDRSVFSLDGTGLSGITFEQPASFEHAKFGGKAGFVGCTFKKGADFSHASFSGDAANFRGCTFKKGADFSHASFSGDAANFRGCTFKKGADFSHASFSGDAANFRGCTFKKGADFSHASFSGDAANFTSARFSETANFLSAVFGKAIFDWSVFGECEFNKAVFRGNASFYDVTFGSMARFNGTGFLGRSDFEESEFKKGADFSGARFERPAHFRRLVTKCPKLIIFDGNISMLSFLNTDMKEISFGTMTTWSPQAPRGDDQTAPRLARQVGDRRPESTLGFHAIWNRKWRIYDEKILDEKTDDLALNLESEQGVYRDLRDNFDQQLRYDVSGGFFVREMEIGRKYTNNENARIVSKPVWRRILTWHYAYNVVAEYGQSPTRPLFFLGAILATGSSLLWCPTASVGGLEIACEDGLGDSILRSLVAMIPLPIPGSLVSPVDIGLKLAALPAVSTFLIALRRRFEKTRRH